MYSNTHDVLREISGEDMMSLLSPFYDFDAPRLVRRNGPPTFSTDTDLTTRAFSWDVNGYYRELGIPFPYVDATRAQISRAYRARDGQRSARLTFCVKQLLHRETREAYDATPIGTPFLDPYVLAAMKAAVLAEVIRQGGMADDADAIKEAFRKRDIIMEDTPEDAVDADSVSRQDDSCPARAVAGFPFSYYLWRSTCDNVDLLEQWQSLLLRAFSARGIKISISLGFLARQPQAYVLGQVGARPVVFLHQDEQPDPEVAEAIAERVQELQRNPPPHLTAYK